VGFIGDMLMGLFRFGGLRIRVSLVVTAVNNLIAVAAVNYVAE
jgi:hypothetical protein